MTPPPVHPAATSPGSWCTAKPDLDRLVRAVGDALTMTGLVPDDRTVVLLDPPPAKQHGEAGVRIALRDAGLVELVALVRRWDDVCEGARRPAKGG
jgi:hypothetical protein